MSQMLRSSGAMGAATFSSRVLGMVREMVYAGFMGDSAVAGAFQLAFTIPNLFRRLLGEGALTAAFIPMLKETEKARGIEESWRVANSVISALLVVGAGVVALVMLGLGGVLAVWQFEPETRLLLDLLVVMFPYMPMVCLAAAFMAMLNSRGHFFVPAMGASMLNVVMIASVFLLAPLMGPTVETQIFGLAAGVLIAGVVQAGFQLPALRAEGYRFTWVNPRNNPAVREVASRMIPGTIGVAAFQLNVVITNGVAYWMDPTIVASFNYAVRLMELPQGVFGVSLATFLLPTLAGLAADKNYPGFRETLRQGMGHLVVANMIASVLLVVLAEPIVRLILERGEFDEGATRRAAFALMCLAPGLVAFSLVNVGARAFFALGDTRTPMKISSVCLGLNLLAALWLLGPFQQGGMGLANSLSAFVNCWLLAYALKRTMPKIEFGGFLREVGKLGIAALAGGIVAWGCYRIWEERLGHGTIPLRVGEVFVPAGAAGAVYAVLAWWFGNPSARELAAMCARKWRRDRAE